MSGLAYALRRESTHDGGLECIWDGQRITFKKLPEQDSAARRPIRVSVVSILTLHCADGRKNCHGWECSIDSLPGGTSVAVFLSSGLRDARYSPILMKPAPRVMSCCEHDLARTARHDVLPSLVDYSYHDLVHADVKPLEAPALKGDQKSLGGLIRREHWDSEFLLNEPAIGFCHHSQG